VAHPWRETPEFEDSVARCIELAKRDRVVLMCAEAVLWVHVLERQTEEVLNQIAFLAGRRSQVHARVVVIHHRVQCWKAPIVIEAALDVREDRAKRKC